MRAGDENKEYTIGGLTMHSFNVHFAQTQAHNDNRV